MRWLVAIACAACSNVTTSQYMDAAVDSPPRRDASSFDAAPAPDAYARRPCDAPPTFADGIQPTRVLHVVPGAGNGTGSEDQPFGTIAAAAAVATPGTWIKLAPGIHASQQFIPNLRGTPTAPIWIGGEWPDQPKILGGTEALHLTRPAYVVIQNLEIASQVVNGINIDDGVAFAGDTTHVALVNIYARDVATDTSAACIRAAGVDNLAVYDSWFRRCLRGVDLIGVHNGIVARGIFDDTFARSVSVRGGSTDVDIRQNRMRDGGGNAIELGGVTTLSQFRPPLSQATPNAEARRVRVFDNFVVGDSGTAFMFNTCVDCLVAHNYVGDRPQFLIRIRQDTRPEQGYTFEPTRNGRVINNSFSWLSGQPVLHIEIDSFNTQIESFTFSHNLWQSPPSLPIPEDGRVIAFSGYSSAGPSQYCGGPEAHAAVALPEIDGTIEGFCRVDGDAPTIGPQMLQLGGCTL